MKVTVYTQPDCPPCHVVKQFLQHHNIPFETVDISEDPRAKEYLVYELQSFSTPTVTVDEDVVKGFDLQTLQKLLHIEE
ncbi:glutaredoxin-like YruB-family protein [Bacillus tianshenii]|uniref:Glutaredoxin-like YruB-family protein n=1 Tax=Sutcliffiella tianshenii TaxID=1463404 RepID=A0ABS2P495_9BACI|nr:glutaredoxin domain-containing protein [Bacillus tianshenii]MBM7621790.1 glutaredoxin-like YruB-family protein [Bacillus tianshenii]MCA1319047.1 glutathione S-transferase N-terminal domain-containing protein [Bacillus tianshenii]